MSIQLKFSRMIAVLAFGLAVGQGMSASAAEITMLPAPVQSQTHLSRLTTDANGQLWLSWVASTESSSALHYASLKDGQWSESRQIAAGSDWFVNWADFPFLSVHDEGMVAHWLSKSANGTYDYDVTASFYNASQDQWGIPRTINTDGIAAEHGFVSMLPMSGGRTFITWLDGRNTKAGKEPHAADEHAQMGGMTLRGAIFAASGETQQEWQLDDLTCDCCQTSAAMAAAGPVVVYRDRTEDEIRDIYITRLVDEQWTEPMAVAADNWQIAGCPVNGPAVSADGEQVAVTWFTLIEGQPQVKLALSNDGGASFGVPVVVAAGETNGRVSIARLQGDDIVVSWLAIDGPEADIMVARYNSQGELQDSATVAATKASRRSGFPVLASLGDDVYLTWTDLVEDMQVRVARISF